MPCIRYIVIQGLMVFVLALMVVDVVLRAKGMIQMDKEHPTTWPDIGMIVYDTLVMIAMPIFIYIRITTVVESAESTSGCCLIALAPACYSLRQRSWLSYIFALWAFLQIDNSDSS